jgi:hypothetical protein
MFLSFVPLETFLAKVELAANVTRNFLTMNVHHVAAIASVVL